MDDSDQISADPLGASSKRKPAGFKKRAAIAINDSKLLKCRKRFVSAQLQDELVRSQLLVSREEGNVVGEIGDSEIIGPDLAEFHKIRPLVCFISSTMSNPRQLYTEHEKGKKKRTHHYLFPSLLCLCPLMHTQ